ncbi:MAG: recombinase family protein [Treponemataceae bacterium]|nr:recombinase family protein [Treponemataceae bacterium]
MSECKSVFDMQNGYMSFVNKDKGRTRRTVFYGRVSTEHEAQISALENQIQWYDDQAKAHSNWLVLDKYIDEGITGTQAKKRPAFLKMLEDARAGMFDLIVTREVCRFARNTVDTLVVTRELKNLGIEVYFVEDNIWTLDGDGELRLTIMATLAQEESRKVSERVKAGQHISREKCVTYGTGNILGYDRVGHDFVINPEQAETVRMIYDMYLNDGLGSTRIARELESRGRLTGCGGTKWAGSYVARVLGNSTYAGIIAYGKSFSNNYLEQKRILNTDPSTYLYKKGNFEPIVTEEEFRRVQDIKKMRLKCLNIEPRRTPFGERPIYRSIHGNNDLWGKRIRCGCGASLRKNRWHKNKGKPWTYGYQCYGQLNFGTAQMHKNVGVGDEDICKIKMVADWKLSFMAQEIFKSLRLDKREIVNEACDILKKCYQFSGLTGKSLEDLNRKLAKIKKRISNLRDMRMDGDIDQRDYRERMKILTEEEAKLNEELEAQSSCLDELEQAEKQDLQAIKAALERILDFSDEKIDDEIIDKFVSRIVVVNDTTFAWYLNLSGKEDSEVIAICEGRKNKAVVSLTNSGETEDFFV